MHFVLAVDGELRVRTTDRGRWTTAAGVLTAPDIPHAIDACGHDQVVIFFDPESDMGAALRPALCGPVRFTSRSERAALVRGIDDPFSFASADSREWAHRVAETLGFPLQESSPVLHPAVRELLERLRKSGVEDDTSLEGLAGALGLSSSRLMHVFTESIGIPLRPYLAWLRVQRSACAILAGASVTEAAHVAGFADAPHMSRTFKRSLGFPPSALRQMRTSQPIQAVLD
ncbi:MAG TPA: AraC family transcriptional regulator [Vicinamibacterales bacterium]|nr:AraC family transcriptional regulator [Vicinamibacterales bacterium]